MRGGSALAGPPVRLSAPGASRNVCSVIPRNVLVLCLAAQGVLAQRPPAPRRGFEPTVTIAVESRHFGGRLVAHGTSTATYQAPLGFSGLLQWPVTRRLATEVEVTYHPDTRQRTDDGTDARISAVSLKHSAARAALAWRLKPFVPVYLFGGGGVAYASRLAAQGLRGGATEPELVFGLGIDPRTHERIGLRLRYLGLVTFPAVPDAPGLTARGPTYDWTWQAGVRLPLNRHLAPSTP